MRKLFKGATMIDCTGRESIQNAAVLVKDSMIEAVGSDEGRFGDLSDATVVDIAGKWIMPGFINMHDHLIFKEAIGEPMGFLERSNALSLTLFAARTVLKLMRRGVTTVRDMGTMYGISLYLREAVERGDLPGPRIFACNQPIACTGGHAFIMATEADGVEGVRRAAREQMKLGADFVKVMASHDPVPMPGPQKTRPELTLEELKAAVDEAHRWGKLTACHCMGEIAIRNVIEAGIDIIDHGIYLNDELAEMMADKEIYLTPTYSAYARQTMNPKYDRGQQWVDAHAPLATIQPDAVKAAIRAGVKILNGTDSTGRYAEEVELLREAGMSSMESLLSCTRYPAEALRLDELIGTIEPG